MRAHMSRLLAGGVWRVDTRVRRHQRRLLVGGGCALLHTHTEPITHAVGRSKVKGGERAPRRRFPLQVGRVVAGPWRPLAPPTRSSIPS